MNVNMNLLPMKGHYFLFNAGTGLVIPYMPVLAKELGFSSVVVGMIYTLLPILALVAKPCMGALADRLHWQKGMFLSFILLTMLSLLLIPWIPAIPEVNSRLPVQLHCDTDSVVKICSPTVGKSDCLPDIVQRIGNTTVHCTMDCEADAGFLESVCDTWKQPRYCASVRGSAQHPILHPLAVNGTSRLRTGADLLQQPPVVLPQLPPPQPLKITYKALAPQTLHFSAELLPLHTEQLSDCLFIRLGRVNFTPAEFVTPYCESFQRAGCQMVCRDAPPLDELLRQPQISDGQALRLYQFWLFGCSLFIGWVSIAIVTSISDAICFELLGDFPSKYGNQRLWGSLGWGLFSFIGGLVIDRYSAGQTTKDHTPVFIMMIGILSLNLLVAWKLKYRQVKTSASILRDVGRLLSEGRVLIFMIWCIATGMCTAMVWNFLFWYLEELANCDTKPHIKTLEGLVMIIQCFGGELPFFFLSGRVLKKIGHIHSMSLVLTAFCLRFLLYSILTNPWWILPIELLNGATFGMAYACMASYASLVAPPGTEATTQGLVGAVFEGLGVSLGSFIGGFLMNKLPGWMVFRIFGAGAMACCVIHAIGQYYFSKKTAVLNIHEKDFKSTRYASPTDAINMLEDQLQEFNPAPR